jgi:hypothetical protein
MVLAAKVKHALSGVWSERLLCGELQLCVPALLQESCPTAWRTKLQLCLDLQLAFVGSWEADEIRYFRTKSSLYCFGLVSGPFSLAAAQLGWTELLRMFANQPCHVKELITTCTEVCKQNIAALLGAGAHGIVLGDDIYSFRGPLFSRRHLDIYLAASYHQLAEYIRGASADAVFHCCGSTYGLADWLQQLGWQGLHGFDQIGQWEWQPPGFCYLGGLTPPTAAQEEKTLQTASALASYINATGQEDRPILLCSSGGLHNENDINWARVFFARLMRRE